MNTQPDRAREPGEDRRAFRLATCELCRLDFWSSGPTVCAECRWKRGENDRFNEAFAEIFGNGRRD